MGTVYRALHVDLAKDFAVKLLRPEVARTDEAARRFEREAEAMSRLRHPGCVAVTDFGRADDGSPFLVMEFLDGKSLAGSLADEGRLSASRAVSIAVQILDAVDAAHATGVVHRDLKPENVMLAPYGVKILDFGIAKILAAGETGITDAQAVFGTPEYLSPEQALGETADERADLYAIGVMLYEMLAGRRPFTGAKMEVIGQHLTREPAPLDSTLWPVVKRALAKKREDRFQSAADFRSALQEVSSADPASASAPASAPDPETVPDETRPLGSAPPDPGSGPLPLPATAPGARRLRLLLPLSLLFLFTALLWLFWPDPPARSDRASAIDVARLALLSDRDVPAARAEAERLARGHPRDAAVLLQLGHLLFAGKDAEPARAMAAYREVVRLDPGLVNGDPRVVEHLAATFGDEVHGEDAFRLAESLGAPAGPAFVAFAGKARRAAPLRRAIRAAEKVGAGDRLDKLRLFAQLLEDGPSCEERREACLYLKATGDSRAIPHLEKALARREGFRAAEEPNACIAAELRDALDALRQKQE
jgi:serine/threonine-protein kinase